MAAPVYSTRFLAQQGLSGAGVPYVVPPGFIAVVKQATQYTQPLLPISVYLEDDETGAALWAVHTDAQSAGWAGFYGAIVIREGQGIHFQVTAQPGDAADVYAGGYLLSIT